MSNPKGKSKGKSKGKPDKKNNTNSAAPKPTPPDPKASPEVDTSASAIPDGTTSAMPESSQQFQQDFPGWTVVRIPTDGTENLCLLRAIIASFLAENDTAGGIEDPRALEKELQDISKGKQVMDRMKEFPHHNDAGKVLTEKELVAELGKGLDLYHICHSFSVWAITRQYGHYRVGCYLQGSNVFLGGYTTDKHEQDGRTLWIWCDNFRKHNPSVDLPNHFEGLRHPSGPDEGEALLPLAAPIKKVQVPSAPSASSTLPVLSNKTLATGTAVPSNPHHKNIALDPSSTTYADSLALGSVVYHGDDIRDRPYRCIEAYKAKNPGELDLIVGDYGRIFQDRKGKRSGKLYVHINTTRLTKDGKLDASVQGWVPRSCIQVGLGKYRDDDSVLVIGLNQPVPQPSHVPALKTGTKLSRALRAFTMGLRDCVEVPIDPALISALKNQGTLNDYLSKIEDGTDQAGFTEVLNSEFTYQDLRQAGHDISDMSAPFARDNGIYLRFYSDVYATDLELVDKKGVEITPEQAWGPPSENLYGGQTIREFRTRGG